MTLVVIDGGAPRRAYSTRDERREMVAPLMEIRARTGAIPTREKRSVARLCGKSLRSIDRAIAEADRPAPARRAWAPPASFLVAVAREGGNVAEAWRKARAADAATPAYPTVARSMSGADPALKVVLREGEAALERYLQIGERSITRRNQSWTMDSTHVPIWCQHGGAPVKDLWLVSAFDEASRLVVAHALVAGAVDSATARQVLQAAMLGREYRAEELGRLLGPDAAAEVLARGPVHLVGGSPDVLLTDNGSEFKGAFHEFTSRALADRYVSGEWPAEEDEWPPEVGDGEGGWRDGAPAAVGGDLDHEYGRPHNPTGRARQERFHRTLKGWLASTPGYTRGARPGPKDAQGRPYAVPADGELLSFDDVRAVVDATVERYNTRHVVRPTGRTPLSAYLLDEAPIRRVPPVALWADMPELGHRKVQRRGVFVDGAYWQSAHGLVPYLERRLAVRGLVGQPGRLFVADPEGRLLTEVWRQPDLTEGDRGALHARNGARARAFRAVLGRAGEEARRAADSFRAGRPEAGGAGEPPPRPGPRERGGSREARDARRAAAAIDRPWDESVFGGDE